MEKLLLVPFASLIITLIILKVIDKVASLNPKWDTWWKDHKQYGWNKGSVNL